MREKLTVGRDGKVRLTYFDFFRRRASTPLSPIDFRRSRNIVSSMRFNPTTARRLLTSSTPQVASSSTASSSSTPPAARAFCSTPRGAARPVSPTTSSAASPTSSNAQKVRPYPLNPRDQASRELTVRSPAFPFSSDLSIHLDLSKLPKIRTRLSELTRRLPLVTSRRSTIKYV
jgi:hypothetical protein